MAETILMEQPKEVESAATNKVTPPAHARRPDCPGSSPATSIADLVPPVRPVQLPASATTLNSSPHAPCPSWAPTSRENHNHIRQIPNLNLPQDLCLTSHDQPQSSKPNKREISAAPSRMIFADLYKSPLSPLSRLRHSHNPNLTTGSQEHHADLLSKDKVKQKEAVKRYLQEKVRDDWQFTWPPPEASKSSSKTNVHKTSELTSDEPPVNEDNEELEGYLEVVTEDPDSTTPVTDNNTDRDSRGEADSETDSIYSTVSEDPLHYRARLEWTSELSEDELPANSQTSFKFESPDSIGKALFASRIAGKTRRRRELRKEIAWNDGLACYEARRNAWTGARTARVRPKLTSPTSPTSPRRGLFWRPHTHSTSNASQHVISPTTASSPLLPIPTNPQHSIYPHHAQADMSLVPPMSPDSENSASHSHNHLSPKSSRTDSHDHYHHSQQEPLPVETLIPIPLPLLPPANPMRASITPSIYLSVYDKVVVHSLQPSCPINLADMVRASVAGWKRDGEWPPRSAEGLDASVVAVRSRRKTSTNDKGGHENGAATRGGGMPTSPSISTARKMSFGFLGRSDKEGENARRSSAEDGGSGTGKTIRRSLQKVLGLAHGPGQHPSPSVAGVLHGNDGNENVRM